MAKQEIQIVCTRRYSEKGLEFIVSTEFDISASLIKYLTSSCINVFELSSENKRTVKIYTKRGYGIEEAFKKLSFCFDDFIGSHVIVQDASGIRFAFEKVKDEILPLNNTGTTSKEPMDRSNQIKKLKGCLDVLLLNEDYLKAAEIRDEIKNLEGDVQ